MSPSVSAPDALEPVGVASELPADRALITDEEWQALLSPVWPVPQTMPASAASMGEAS